MLKPRLLSLLVASALLSLSAQSQAISLIAQGQLNGSSAGANTDLSGLTNTLENGVAANFLGGLGSGLAWAGGNTFVAVPDRGPNATAYNSAIDDTTSYISRFHTVTMGLTASASGLPFSLTPTLQSTTLLWSKTALNYAAGGAPAQNTAGKFYFSGRSDNFAAGNSLNPNNARFDPEGVRVSNDGKSVFISDEYGPYVYQFDRATGERIRAFALPSALAVSTLGPTTGSEGKPTNTTGRVANKGMEGLAITPDGKTLVGMMQAALLQDSSSYVRLVTIDVATGNTQQFAYKLTDGSGVSEITAINDHEFLVDERDGKGLGDGTNAGVKKLYKIDISGATPIPANASGNLTPYLVSKTATAKLDLVAQLTKSIANGGAGLTTAQIPAKIEGVTFGQDVQLNGQTLHTLWVANDNDFVPGVAGNNRFFVFGVTDAELGAAFTAQAITPVPEPETYALMMAGLLGIGLKIRRKAR